jgi:hypothetical protein
MLGLDRVALLLERQGGASRTPSAPAVAIRGADLGEALTRARRERAAGARVRFGNGGAS